MDINPQKNVHLILRIATAMCFIGHGAFGIITKAIWCNYFAVFGIGEHLAYQLMPVLGSFDILLGIIMLVYPVRAIPAWLVIWGILTALLRPLSGEPFAEFIERAGNYGAPFCLLLLSGIPKNSRDLFTRMQAPVRLDALTFARVTNCLKLVVFLLFLGHGWLNVTEKGGLLKQYASLGFSDPIQVAKTIGVIEIIAALSLLIKPLRPVIFILFFWKMGSEILYPHDVMFEWIERGGSYGAILALWVITERHSVLQFTRGENYHLQNAG